MVGIIILNYNNPEVTINCFESIIKYNTAPCKYIFVDNASKDKSVEILDGYFRQHFDDRYQKYKEGDSENSLPYISLVEAHDNIGYACGNNIGLKFAEKDKQIEYILILNNDVLFVDDIIPSMMLFVNNTDDAALVSPLLLKKDGKTIDYSCARRNVTVLSIIQTYICNLFSPFLNGVEKRIRAKYRIIEHNLSLLEQESVEIELPSGSCMFIEKELFKSIGYFDPRTFLYYEENILHKKIYSIGRKNYLLTKLNCIHLGASTTKQTTFSLFQLKQLCHSAYIYANYYAEMNILEKKILKILLNLLLWRKKFGYKIKTLINY